MNWKWLRCFFCRGSVPGAAGGARWPGAGAGRWAQEGAAAKSPEQAAPQKDSTDQTQGADEYKIQKQRSIGDDPGDGL